MAGLPKSPVVFAASTVELKLVKKKDKCPGHVSGQHVYKYEVDRYTCKNCGITVQYDIMNRDTK